MIKSVFKKWFLLCFLASLSYTSFSSTINREESITITSYNTLVISKQPYPDATETRDLNLAAFNQKFHQQKDDEINNNCGKLTMNFGSWFWNTKYVGSGSLISYDDNTKQFEGITAKHNIFNSKAWWYTTAYNVSFYVGEHQGSNIGEISVNSYIPHSTLDVCLFYGTYTGQNEEAIRNNLLQISSGPTLPQQDFKIIHYPNGVKEQRFNTGSISNVRGLHAYYTVDTLGGSSGAPLLKNNNEIFGIHICGHERPDLAIRYDDGKGNVQRFKVSNENECILIDESFISILRKNTLYYL